MYRAVAFDESLRREWDLFALSNGTVFHTSQFRDILLESFGYRCAYHAILDGDGKICALAPLVVSRNLGFRKAGVSLPFANYLDISAVGEDARTAAIQFVQRWKSEKGLDYVELRLKNQTFVMPEWDEQLQNFTFELALGEDEEKILARASAGCRSSSPIAIGFPPGM